MRPVLLVGAGRMGGALLDGWRLAGEPAMDRILIEDPSPGAAAFRAAEAGATLHPKPDAIRAAQAVVFAVKPQGWREAARVLSPLLAADAVVISVAAGVSCAALGAAFARPAVRVMPTTAAAVGKGVSTLYAADAGTRTLVRALFAPVGVVVDVPSEGLINPATAVAGSGPAYFYAFVEALESAGVIAGLPRPAARTLARATFFGAAALMETSGAEAADLRMQVTSKGGTTEAALSVLQGAEGLQRLVREAVLQALRRAGELEG